MKLQGLDAWLHCLLTDGLGPARWLALMQRWGEPEAVLAARQDDLAEILGPAFCGLRPLHTGVAAAHHGQHRPLQ